MMDERDIGQVLVEVGGHEPPYELTLTVVGFVRDRIDADRIIPVVHEHGSKMVPDIVAALEREVLRRVRIAGQPEDFEL